MGVPHVLTVILGKRIEHAAFLEYFGCKGCAAAREAKQIEGVDFKFDKNSSCVSVAIDITITSMVTKIRHSHRIFKKFDH